MTNKPDPDGFEPNTITFRALHGEHKYDITVRYDPSEFRTLTPDEFVEKYFTPAAHIIAEKFYPTYQDDIIAKFKASVASFDASKVAPQ